MVERSKTRSGFSALDLAGLILIIGLLSVALGALTLSRGWTSADALSWIRSGENRFVTDAFGEGGQPAQAAPPERKPTR